MENAMRLLKSLTKPVAHAWHSLEEEDPMFPRREFLVVEFDDGTANTWNLAGPHKFFTDDLTLKDEPGAFLDPQFYAVTQLA